MTLTVADIEAREREAFFALCGDDVKRKAMLAMIKLNHRHGIKLPNLYEDWFRWYHVLSRVIAGEDPTIAVMDR